jgi:hypothetical protein
VFVKSCVVNVFSLLVFGVDLTTLVKAHNTKLPTIVEDCVREVEKRGNFNFLVFFVCRARACIVSISPIKILSVLKETTASWRDWLEFL